MAVIHVRVGRLALVVVVLLLLMIGALVPALHHIKEDPRANSTPADGSVELTATTADGNGLLLAVQSTTHGQTADTVIFGRVNKSPWSSFGTPDPHAELRAVAFDSGTMAAVGHVSSGATVWTRIGTSAWHVAYRGGDPNANFDGIAVRAGVFAALSSSPLGVPTVVRGEGSTWTPTALPLPEGSTHGVVSSVIASPTGFVVAGGADTTKGLRPFIWRSNDAAHWSLVPLPFDAVPSAGRTNGFATAVAIGAMSTAVVGTIEGLPVAWLETSGAWSMTRLPIYGGANMPSGLAARPGGGFVAAGTVTTVGDNQHGIAWTSQDGHQWRATDFAQATGLRDVVVSNRQVVLVGRHRVGTKIMPLVVVAPPS